MKTFAAEQRNSDPPVHTGRSWLNVVSHLDPRYGGISTMLPSFCKAVAEEGTKRVSIAAFCAPDERFDLHESISFQRFAIGKAAWLRDVTLRQQLRLTIGDSAGVHIHGLWQEHCALASWMARTQSKPYIVSAHGMLDSWAIRNKRWKKLLYSWLVENHNLRNASCLHALTASEAGDYRRAGVKAPVVIIPNGVDVPTTGDSEQFLSKFPHLRGKQIVLFLGRIHFKKGLDILCRAWQHASRRGNAHLVLAGPDFEGTKATVERLIEELGIADTVTFTGMLDRSLKWSALSAAHVFVLPSYSEGLSVSVLEAMGMGVPVIVTRQCNVPDVEKVECGWTIQPNKNLLQEALEQSLKSPSTHLAEMGERGRAVVRERYSWNKIGQQTAEVYQWLLGGSKPSSIDVRIN